MTVTVDGRTNAALLTDAEHEMIMTQRHLRARMGTGPADDLPKAIQPADSPADSINPKHYRGDLVARIIETFGLGFNLGNVTKYILRHQAKAGLEDLKKARWYLDREITAQEGKLPKGLV